MMKSYTWSSAGGAAEPLVGAAPTGAPTLGLPVAPAADVVGTACAALEPLPVAEPTFAPAPAADEAGSTPAAAPAFAGFEAAADPPAAALANRIRSMSARTFASATP